MNKEKIKIGTKIHNDKHHLVVLDVTTIEKDKLHRSVKKGKEYIYNIKQKIQQCKIECFKCGYKGLVRMNTLEYGGGCPCCCNPPKIIVSGINDIPTTDPWMIPFFQGGEKEASQYTSKSNQKIYPICPDCGKISNKMKSIASIHKYKSINCTCNDGISYPEKFIIGILEQLNVNYIYQCTKNVLNWCKKYRYDFYLPNYNCIIEVHGKQHYEKCNFPGRSLDYEQQNDKIKERLAKNNGIENYIVIDARRSNLEFIKQNVLASKLSNLINLNNIKWEVVQKYALKNYLIEICKFWETYKHQIVHTDLQHIFKLTNFTIKKYLKKGHQIGICVFDEGKEFKRARAQEKLDITMLYEICEYWNNKQLNKTTRNLASYFNVHIATIIKYLKKGNEIGWCTYDAKEEMSKINKNKVDFYNSQCINIYFNGIFVKQYASMAQMERESKNDLGIKIYSSYATQYFNNKRKNYKGYTFERANNILKVRKVVE